jgi:membrane protease YdiL (CAAX protease family)
VTGTRAVTGPFSRANRGRTRVAAVLPHWLVDKVPRDHRETDEAFRRRRKVVAGVSVAGAGLLGVSLSTKPASPEFYGLTLGVAATWVAGGIASGPLHLGWMQSPDDTLKRPVLTPVAMGGAAFAVFYAGALISKKIPPLERAVAKILRYAQQGNQPLVYLTTLANGAAEEVFFRGALFAALGVHKPVAKSTAIYALATTATRNPSLVLASGLMGTLFGLQRRASGGFQASMLTHLTWSVLMLKFLPPLFADHPDLHAPLPPTP